MRERRGDRRRDNPAAQRIDMRIAATALLRVIKPLRNHQVQLVLGAGHGNIEQAPFLLEIDALQVARSEGRQPSITLRMNTAAIPGVWRNGWWTTSGKPHRAAARQLRRRWRWAGRGQIGENSARAGYPAAIAAI